MSWIDRCVRIVFAFLIGAIIVILITMGETSYICKTTFLYPNIYILLFNIFILFVAFVTMYMTKNKLHIFDDEKKVNYDRVVKYLTVFLFLIEIYISYNIHFKTGWDVSAIWANAKEIAFGDRDQLNNYYYSQNPNNLFITLICAVVLKLNSGLGVFHGDHENMALIFCNCICISAACYLVYAELKQFVSQSIAFCGYVFAVLLAGISPWMTICYSDTLGILFPILIIYLCTCLVHSKMGKVCKYIGIILLSSIGYLIKPQILIVFIAAFIVNLCYGLKKHNGKEICLTLASAAICLLCVLSMGKCLDKLYEKIGFEINEEAAFGPTHFFMMGLNESTNGVWAQEDVETSSSCETAEERRNVNIQVSIQRMKDFGVVGYAKHLCRKLICTYNDGTFAWGHEGGFFSTIYDEPNTRAASFLRSFCYPKAKYRPVFRIFAQTIWILVLMLNFGASLLFKADQKNKYVSVIMLSLIGITVFEALFEVRARYLFIYVPFYCMVAAMGADAVWKKVNTVINK